MGKIFFKSYQKYIRESGAGYTVLELLVVIAIIAVISAMVVSSIPLIKSQFSLSRVANRFQQDVRRSQELALSSIEFTDAMGTHPVKGYGIYIDASNNARYIIYADRAELPENNKQYDPGLDYIVQTINFAESEPGIIIKDVRSVGVHFNPPNPITTLQPPIGSTLEIVFAIESDLSKTKTVSINTTGLVEIK